MLISRTGAMTDLLIWFLLFLMWFFGGWSIGAAIFRLRARERIFAGMAIGFLLFIVFADIIALIGAAAGPGSLTGAYWGAAITVLALGLLAAWRRNRLFRIDLRGALSYARSHWLSLIIFALTFLLFTWINFGLAIFDDFANLPIVSMIAAGNFPPLFHLNSEIYLDYHYGVHLFAASLVRLGGLYPWVAFDISKAFSTTLTIFLAWLWLRRYMRPPLAIFSCLGLIVFASGARWLLLFAPADWLQRVSANMQLLGSAAQTAPDFYSALPLPWNIAGDGPYPFAFAFTNGIFSPLTMALSGSGALPQMTIFILLLLARRAWRPLPGLITGLLLTSLALTGEHLFVMLWGGIFIASILAAWRQRSLNPALSWGWVLLPGMVLSPWIGGVITEITRNAMLPIFGSMSSGGVAMPAVGLRWPPAFLSSHLGVLSITDPGQVLVALAEMGPLILLIPFALWLTWKAIRAGKIFYSGLGLAALIGFVTPMFIRFSARERDLSRLTAGALFIWLILLIPSAWYIVTKTSYKIRWIMIGVALIMLLGGIALIPPQLNAMQRPQASYFIEEPDIQMSKLYWNQFDPAAQVLDLGYIHRSPSLFGRGAGKAYQDVYIAFPEFRALSADPNPHAFAQAGYDYIYLDKKTWLEMTDTQRQAFKHACVRQIDEKRTVLNDFRRLLDIRRCTDTP